MSLSMQGSGRESWESSPCMDMRDRGSRESAAHPSKRFHPLRSRLSRLSHRVRHGLSSEKFCPGPGSVERDAERSSDRRALEDALINNPEAQSVLQEGEFGRVDPTGWFPHYKRCVQFFVTSSQHSPIVQSIAAFINIRLPYHQGMGLAVAGAHARPSTPAPFVSLRPYIRRLIVTAQDSPAVLQAFFGDDWEAGVGCIYKQERVNFLFTAKSSGWASTKAAYDILPDEQAPFLRPLRDPSEDEIRAAEARWSEWLAMEDWMVGGRSPW